MRSVKYLVVAGAASLLAEVLAQAAFAADMPSIMPPPPQQYYAPPPSPQDFGGWYLRGDIGMTNSKAKLHDNLYDTLPAGAVLQQNGEGFTGGTSYGVGIGYQFNSWFRADITGEYRSRVSFTGTDYVTYPFGGGSIGDQYTGGYTSWVGLVNAYADLGTWWCLTPFVGFGVGGAKVQTTGLQDVLIKNGAQGSYFAQGAEKTNAAWALHAGVAYKVNSNFTIELAYRYLDLGTAVHGNGASFDGSNAGPSSFQYRDLTSQDVKLGVRWTCCDVEPAAPPPQPVLMRRG